MTRYEMVDFLVDKDIEHMVEDAQIDNYEVIASILECGFRGYAYYTDEELISEVKDREVMATMGKIG